MKLFSQNNEVLVQRSIFDFQLLFLWLSLPDKTEYKNNEKMAKIDTSKIRVIFEYECQRGSNVADTVCNNNAAFGDDTANEYTVRF